MNETVLNSKPNDQGIACTAIKLRAISHPLRLKILCGLNKNEMAVQDIVEMSGASQSNISQHLTTLRNVGILESRRDANRIFYRISDRQLLEVIRLMRQTFCTGPTTPAN